MIDDQLGAPVEEIGERKSAIWPLKLIGFFHALPGHPHSAARQHIMLAREFLLGSKQSRRAFSHSSCETTLLSGMCVSLLTSVSGAGIWQEEGKPPVTLKAGNNLLVPAGTEGSKIYADTRPLCNALALFRNRLSPSRVFDDYGEPVG